MKLKTDLTQPKNFNRNQYELEEFLIICAFVAGKNSKMQYQKVEMLFDIIGNDITPFESLRNMTHYEIMSLLVHIKSGQYARLCRCLFELSRSCLDLKTCSTEDLESIHGIGMKTSRFFITYSRENSQYAILDTHILAWLRNFDLTVPKATPNNKKQYLMLERMFLEKCAEKSLKPHELDIQLWLERQKSWKA